MSESSNNSEVKVVDEGRRPNSARRAESENEIPQNLKKYLFKKKHGKSYQNLKLGIREMGSLISRPASANQEGVRSRRRLKTLDF